MVLVALNLGRVGRGSSHNLRLMTSITRHCEGLSLSRPAHRHRTAAAAARRWNSSSTATETPSSSTRTIAGAAALFVGGGLAARLLYPRLLADNNERSLLKDASRATVFVQTVPSRNKVPLSQKELDQSHPLKEVDAKEFQQFARNQQKILQKAHQEKLQAAKESLHNNVLAALSEADDRVDAFCDWYLSYPTTYKLLGIALKSAAEHVVTWNKQATLTQKVAADLEKHVCRKYEAIVLRPALIDPQIHRAMTVTLHQAHEEYLQSIQQLEMSVAHFVTSNAQTYRHAPTPQDVVIQLDWAAQLQKVQHIPTAYDKSPERTVALITASAAAGKVAGATATISATKALAAKLVAPFASKAAAATLSGKAAAGAAGGAALGGPIGSVAGAAIGIGVDVSVNTVAGLFQRSALQEDVRLSLRTTAMEWEENVLRPEVEHVLQAWYEHAENLLSGDGYSQKSQATSPA